MRQFTIFGSVIVLCLCPNVARTQENELSDPDSVRSKMQVFETLRGLTDDSLIQEELQISDAQLREVGKAIADVRRGEQRASFEMMKLRLAPPVGPFDEFLESVKVYQARVKEIMSFYDDAFNSLSESLLPHQLERLRQLTQQAKLLQFENKGFSGILYAPLQLSAAIGIPDSEFADLQARISDIEKEYRNKLATLKEETFQAVLDELDADQRAKAETLIGPLFDFEESERNRLRNQRQKLMEKYRQSSKNDQ